ncbi:metallophosphoesterase family protein [Maricaulis sp.]|uniref:metallophosphoesterase family protein n=1 Tax=Maricaulis sp. TaxID=1486257 RepID=UPI003A8E2C77
MTRIIHIADLHFGAEDAELVAGFEAACAELEPDLIVAAGDFTQAARWRELDAASALFTRIDRPVVGRPGNHDVPVYVPGERAFRPWRRFERSLGDQVRPSWSGPDVQVETLHTARRAQWRPDWSLGRAAPRDVDAALDAFAAAGAKTRILACHHPLVAPDPADARAATHGGAEAARRLSAACDLVLTGHLHETFVLPSPDPDQTCWFIGTGTTFSRRTRLETASFNLIEIDPEGIRMTRQESDPAGRFGAGRVWELERRER